MNNSTKSSKQGPRIGSSHRLSPYSIFSSGREWLLHGALFIAMLFSAFPLFAVFAGTVLLDDLLGASKFVEGDAIVAGRKQAVFSDASKAVISEDSIKTISLDPSVRKVWPVLSNAFDTEISIDLGSVRYRSEMFFEAVDDRALGELPEGWRRRDILPILISKDFLALYNLAFAPSRGLPVLNEALFASFPLEVVIRGTLGTERIKAVIVGTSGTFSSFLIPEEIMRMYNERIAGVGGKIRRVVITSYDATAPGLASLLSKEGLEPTSGGIMLSEVQAISKVVSLLLGSFGIAIALLGITVSILGTRVFTERKRGDLELLVLLGYKPGMVAFFSAASVLLPCLAAFAAAMLGSGFLFSELVAFLSRTGLATKTPFPVFACVIAFIPCPLAFLASFAESFRLKNLWLSQ